jgi:DNA-binding XRE family transcriptional regulator
MAKTNNQPTRHEFAQYHNDLRLERRNRRLSNKQVAALIGKSLATLRRYERGDLLPSLPTALKLQILYRTQLASIYQSLYANLTDEMRARETQVWLARGKRHTS